jgi:hypothetical protein
MRADVFPIYRQQDEMPWALSVDAPDRKRSSLRQAILTSGTRSGVKVYRPGFNLLHPRG